MEKIKLCDEGATLLAEAILKSCYDDYKYCWLIKKKRKGGNWVFVYHKPKSTKPRKKYIITRSDWQLLGKVDDILCEIEEYIRNHQILSEISEDIIRHLREEAMRDEELIAKVKEIA